MGKVAGVTLQARFNLAQAPCAAKLRIQHRDQMGLGLYDAPIPVGFVLIHKLIEGRPRNMLQKPMKNDILIPHGVDPFRVQMIRNQLETSRINAVRLFKHEPCRTLVGLTRPSTTCFIALSKTWMPGTSLATPAQARPRRPYILARLISTAPP